MSWNLDEAIAYYKMQGAPGDQNAVIGLLREVQSGSNGSIPLYVIERISSAYAVKESYLLAVIKRIPSLLLADTHCLEICVGPNCSKRAVLGALMDKIHDTHPEKFTVKYVPCMRMCGKGPNIKLDGKLYHHADEVLLCRLIEEI